MTPSLAELALDRDNVPEGLSDDQLFSPCMRLRVPGAAPRASVRALKESGDNP